MPNDETADGSKAATFGMHMYPTQGTEPVRLWADSWEERELWKTAITEGVSLLAQKERVIRRDHKKKKKHWKAESNHQRRRSRSDLQQIGSSDRSHHNNGRDRERRKHDKRRDRTREQRDSSNSFNGTTGVNDDETTTSTSSTRQTTRSVHKSPSKRPTTSFSSSSSHSSSASSTSKIAKQNQKQMTSSLAGVSNLANELKTSILTRFSTESRDSSVGFDLNNAADRVCLMYLRSISSVSTEHTNITNVLHPLLVKLYGDIKQKIIRETAKRTTLDRATKNTGSSGAGGKSFKDAAVPGMRNGIYTPSSFELKYICQFEQEYYTSTMIIRSHRQNVMLSLKPKLRQFVDQTTATLTKSSRQGTKSSQEVPLLPQNGTTTSDRNSTHGESKHNNIDQDTQKSNATAGLNPRGTTNSATKHSIGSSPSHQSINSNRTDDPASILTAGGCPPGVLHVQVLRGHTLRETQRFMRQDPYVTLQCSGMRKYVRTKYIRSGGSEPSWSKEDNNEFSLHIQGSMDVVQYPEICHIEGKAWLVGVVSAVVVAIVSAVVSAVVLAIVSAIVSAIDLPVVQVVCRRTGRGFGGTDIYFYFYSFVKYGMKTHW